MQPKTMQPLILHIPHSSSHIPSREGYVVEEEVLKQEMLKLTDWYTNYLFYSQGEVQVVAPFSRIFCDPERFTDDALEPMAKFGMGVLYATTDEGQIMRELSNELRESILTHYYWKHHDQLNQLVHAQLKEQGRALILDGHSFPSRPFKRDLDQSFNRPDFNIGTDPYHTPQRLVDFSVDFFHRLGYSVGIDWPYRGSIVPLEQYGKNKQVESIMLEVNRALYLKEPSNEKSDRYPEIKRVVGEYIRGLKVVGVGR